MTVEVELYDSEKGLIEGRMLIETKLIRHIIEQDFGCTIHVGKLWFDTTMNYEMMKELKNGKQVMVFNPFNYPCSSADIHDIARILSEVSRKGGNPENN